MDDPLWQRLANIIQSKIAIGSGGIFWQRISLKWNTRTTLIFNRKQILFFTMLAEELTGFVGCLLVIGIYFF